MGSYSAAWSEAPVPKSVETERLLHSITSQLTSFLRKAEEETTCHQLGTTSYISPAVTSLVPSVSLSSNDLRQTLCSTLSFTDLGTGHDGLEHTVSQILDYSVNTSAPGFLDKLTAAPLPPGIIAELVLGVLNTNLHVYHVSPVLTLIEKFVTGQLADLFGLKGSRRGGISVQGGSASNLTSIAVARNTLYPQTKNSGNRSVDGELVVFASAHGHYSIQKAAEALGLGSNAVIPVPVEEGGRMIPHELEKLILSAKEAGKIPFYISATAGTTVLGAFDPFDDISVIAKAHNMWFHVDASWGGGFAFSQNEAIRKKLKGIGKADSIAFNPHKMLGVPMTCSFLLGNDMRQFHTANSLKARYLFHDDLSDDQPLDSGCESAGLMINDKSEVDHVDSEESEDWVEPDDLADMTLQCGRRGDSLKLFLCWQYYGTVGYSNKIDHAYDLACYFLSRVRDHPHLTSVLSNDKNPACLQVCFHFTPFGKFMYGTAKQDAYLDALGVAVAGQGINKERSNSRVTANMARALVDRGFMVDYAPALEGQEEDGNFFRVVVNISTVRETVDSLIENLVAVGMEQIAQKVSSAEVQTASAGIPFGAVSVIVKTKTLASLSCADVGTAVATQA